MSALGHEQTSRPIRIMSVIPLKADIRQREWHVRSRRSEQKKTQKNTDLWEENGALPKRGLQRFDAPLPHDQPHKPCDEKFTEGARYSVVSLKWWWISLSTTLVPTPKRNPRSPAPPVRGFFFIPAKRMRFTKPQEMP